MDIADNASSPQHLEEAVYRLPCVLRVVSVRPCELCRDPCKGKLPFASILGPVSLWRRRRALSMRGSLIKTLCAQGGTVVNFDGQSKANVLIREDKIQWVTPDGKVQLATRPIRSANCCAAEAFYCSGLTYRVRKAQLSSTLPANSSCRAESILTRTWMRQCLARSLATTLPGTTCNLPCPHEVILQARAKERCC